MIIQRVNRTDAEKVYIVVHNVDATSVTTGQGAVYCNAANAAAAAASADGKSVIRVTGSNDLMNFAGIAAQDIPADGYGRTQIWGYCDSIMVSHRAANTTIGAGLIAESVLIPAGLAGTWTSTAGQDALSVINPGIGPRVMIFDTVVLSLSLHSAGANVWAKGFVRGF